MCFRLDSDAAHLVRLFFMTYPKLCLYEAHDHGISPLKFPDMYMTDELMTEPNHHLIAKKVEENRGIMTGDLAAEWIQEEIREHQK